MTSWTKGRVEDSGTTKRQTREEKREERTIVKRSHPSLGGGSGVSSLDF
jgi:hypothetical protein